MKSLLKASGRQSRRIETDSEQADGGMTPLCRMTISVFSNAARLGGAGWPRHDELASAFIGNASSKAVLVAAASKIAALTVEQMEPSLIPRRLGSSTTRRAV